MKSSIRTIILISLLLFLGLCSFSQPQPAWSLTPAQLRSRLEVKFRRVGTIYLEAVGFPREDPSDTVQFFIAYRYPEQFLQIMQGRDDREQIVIFSRENLVLAYPQLDVLEKHQLDSAERDQLIARNIPLAGLIGALQSDELLDERVKTVDHGDTVEVNIDYPDPRVEFDKTFLVIEKTTLRPLIVETTGEQIYRIQITDYREDERLPRPVERAIDHLDPQYLEGFTDV